MTANMEKPVHKVLEDYDLLNVSVIQNTNTINMSAARLWRMNLCAASNEIPCTFFVAMNYRVNVYTIDTAYSPFKDPHKTLASPNARQTGGASESPYVINSIKIDRLLQKEVLVTTSENGEVCIWRTKNLDEPPMILSNEVATWGIAIHADQGLVAVSGNNWRITIFNILEMTRGNPIFGSANKRNDTNKMGKELKMKLIGHEHNIPNIDFSETGQYIASASIDQTCRVWDITTKKVVTQKKTPTPIHGEEEDPWCWTVKFIKPGHFKYAVCIDKSVNRAFLQRVYQGRSTSLTNIGLCHSAESPSFPANVSNVRDLGDEEIDFSDTNEVDISAWDNSLLQEEEDFLEEVFERQRQEGNPYNYGEIPNTNHNPTHNEMDESDLSDTYESGNETHAHGFENPFPPTDSVEGLMQDEIEYLFNQGLSDENRGSDEIIQEQSQESDQEGDQENNLESDSMESQESMDPDEEYEEYEDANDENINMWTADAPALPTQDDWTRSIVNDNSDGNRDGWGDEIVSVMRNSSIDESGQPTSESPLNNNWNDQVPLDGLQSNTHDVNQSNDTPSNIKSSSDIIRGTNATYLEDKKENGKKTLGEYLMVSTGKDIMMLSTSTPKMSRIKAEHNIISKVDVRSDQMLSVLDRINMVEWLPELELYVAASQKGTVALMRILQVEFEGGEQACVFNNECYLPTGVFQSAPLYGMTVKRIESERFTPISYQVFLFYYSGNVLGYTVSRKDCDIMVENFIV